MKQTLFIDSFSKIKIQYLYQNHQNLNIFDVKTLLVDVYSINPNKVFYKDI